MVKSLIYSCKQKNKGLCIEQKRAHPITPIWPTDFTNGKKYSSEEDYYAFKIHIWY